MMPRVPPPRRRAAAGAGLQGWLAPAVLTAAALSAATGFASFSVTAALADVAAAFGEVDVLDGVAATEAGLLSGTTVGVGMAVIRLASLGALPLAGLADRHGRRRVLLGCCGLGLAFTVATAASPSYWWFVAIFALGRPLLSATNAVASVIAAEETSSRDRSKAMALITAAYAVGAGLPAIVRGFAADALGFRGLLALSLLPLLALPLASRWLREPPRFARVASDPALARPARTLLRAIPRDFVPRLRIVFGLHVAFGFVTGPVNTFLFFYAEGILGLAPWTLSVIVLLAAPIGLAGLFAGRWAADAVGRRVTAGAALAAVGVAGMLTYSGAPLTVGVGYLSGILIAAVYAPAAGALDAELFPTSIRSTAAGWITVANVLGAVAGLLAFGALADVLGGFEPAAVVIGLPAVLASVAYALLPETRGLELEDSAPERPAPDA